MGACLHMVLNSIFCYCCEGLLQHRCGELSEVFVFTAEQRLRSKVRRVLTWIDSSS